MGDGEKLKAARWQRSRTAQGWQVQPSLSSGSDCTVPKADLSWVGDAGCRAVCASSVRRSHYQIPDPSICDTGLNVVGTALGKHGEIHFFFQTPV